MTDRGSAAAPRAAQFIFRLAAIGEVGIGIAGIVAPNIIGTLLAVQLEAPGLLAARLAAVAVLSLGVTWWTDRKDPERIRRDRVGFIVYNLGVAVLFGFAALNAGRSVWPWLVGAIHLVGGLIMVVATLVPPGTRSGHER